MKKKCNILKTCDEKMSLFEMFF